MIDTTYYLAIALVAGLPAWVYVGWRVARMLGRRRNND